MKIVKKVDYLDERIKNENRRLANMGCNRCPFCDETMTVSDAINRGCGLNRGISVYSIEVPVKESWFSRKAYKTVTRYSCNRCREENEMPVFIKGMTMPESCEDCRFLCDFGHHYKICGAVDRELIVTDLILVRHDECPLCEVDMGNDMVVLSNNEYNELIATTASRNYDKDYEQGRKYAIDNLWSELQDRTEKIKQSNPPEFLAKCMNIRVPDCNDCGYLNYTEKQQQAYGANSYKKDHRCNCYNRPLYHRASFRNHDPYIYPCDKCREDNFVNYFDCESSKCNKKGE